MTAKFNNLRTIAQTAVAEGVSPGLAVVVGEGGQLGFAEAFGQRQLAPAALPATLETMWDLASLTKALVTSVLAMQAVGRGLIRLDEPVSASLLGFDREDTAGVTVRHLLSHSAGLPAHRPLYAEVLAPDGAGAGDIVLRSALVNRASAEPLVYQPGTRSLYSDLGFIALGALLEQRLGGRLDEAFERDVAGPLGLHQLRFLPSGSGAEANVAATERCPVRARLVAGEVHDLNAYAMGGVAGHAGLFGTAADVGVMAVALCAAHQGASGLIDRDVLRTFFAPAGVPGSTWRLGWDGPSDHGSLAGDRISRAAVGHLGFTGCSLWMEPARETFVLVLANRVHPIVRDDPRFRVLRRALNDAALEAIAN